MLAYKIVLNILRPIMYFFYRLKITGRENIPDDAVVVCGNHTSNLDAIFVCIAFDGGKPLSFMAKQELFSIPLLSALLRSINAIPVNRGATEISTLRNAISTLKAGDKVMVFPEGHRVSADEESEGAKTGAAMIACRAKVDMLPVYISVKKRIFKRTNVIIGKPISTQDAAGEGSAKYRAVVDSVFSEIMRLGQGGEL